MSSKKLHELDLSQRAFNCCRKAGIETIADLRAYYIKHRSFFALNGCGRRTDGELKAVLLNDPAEPAVEDVPATTVPNTL